MSEGTNTEQHDSLCCCYACEPGVCSECSSGWPDHCEGPPCPGSAT